MKNIAIIASAGITMALSAVNIYFWQLSGSMINLVAGLINIIATITLIVISGENFKK